MSLFAGQFSASANVDLLIVCSDIFNEGFKRYRGVGDGTFTTLPDTMTLLPLVPPGYIPPGYLSLAGGTVISQLQVGAFGGAGQALTYKQWVPPDQSAYLLCFLPVTWLIADFDAGGALLPSCSAEFDVFGSLIDLTLVGPGADVLATPPFNWSEQAAFSFLPDGKLQVVVSNPGRSPVDVPGFGNFVEGTDQSAPLGQRQGHAEDVGLLKGVGADERAADLTGDADQGNGIHLRVCDAGDQVGRARTARRHGDADFAGDPGVALGRKYCALLVTRQYVAHSAAIERVV